MRYFTIMSGLRGCYMPDSAYVVACSTRRELKSVIASEASGWADGFTGGSQRAIAALAANAWREAGKRRPDWLPYCLPLSPNGNRGNASHGIFAGVATRREYLDHCRDND